MKIAVACSITTFLSYTLTLILVSGLNLLGHRIGILQLQTRETLMLTMAFPSIIIGTAFARFSSFWLIAPIVEISNASKKIAKGNFNINLKLKSHIIEVQEMADNFTSMTKELTKTEMLRSDFVTNVSHEFKTPLAAIEGYTMLLQDEMLSGEKRAFYLDKILTNTKRMSTMMSNVLWLSRLDNQDLVSKKETFSLDEQIREIVLLYESEWTAKKLELDIDLETVDYYGNAELLSQVWQNLIGNAVKFVHEEGLVRVSLRTKGEQLQVEIYDNGIGIGNEAKERIYEKFYQGDTSHTTEGNGLGLTMVKSIVELLGGHVSLASLEGRGTKFTVTIPKITSSTYMQQA